MQQERRKHNGHFSHSTKEVEAVEISYVFCILLLHPMHPAPPPPRTSIKGYGCVDYQEILSLSFHAPLEAPSAKKANATKPINILMGLSAITSTIQNKKTELLTHDSNSLSLLQRLSL